MGSINGPAGRGTPEDSDQVWGSPLNGRLGRVNGVEVGDPIKLGSVLSKGSILITVTKGNEIEAVVVDRALGVTFVTAETDETGVEADETGVEAVVTELPLTSAGRICAMPGGHLRLILMN